MIFLRRDIRDICAKGKLRREISVWNWVYSFVGGERESRFRLALGREEKGGNKFERDRLSESTKAKRVQAVSCPGVVSGAREGKRVVQLPRSLTDKLTYANTASLRPVI